MRFIIFFIMCVIFSPVTALAEGRDGLSKEEIKANAKVLDAHVSLIVGKADVALTSLAEVIKRVDLTEEDAHEMLGRMTGILNGVRAMIFIAADGTLKFDSFSYPVPKVNLSLRSYFMSAMNNAENELIIGKSVAGQTSGIPFIPMAKAVWKDGKFFGVLVAVITPSTLVLNEVSQNCLHCISIVTDLSGNTVSQFPTGLELNEELKNKLHTHSLSVKGTEIIKIGDLKARIYWIRNEEHPLISIFLEFIKG